MPSLDSDATQDNGVAESSSGSDGVGANIVGNEGGGGKTLMHVQKLLHEVDSSTARLKTRLDEQDSLLANAAPGEGERLRARVGALEQEVVLVRA